MKRTSHWFAFSLAFLLGVILLTSPPVSKSDRPGDRRNSAPSALTAEGPLIGAAAAARAKEDPKLQRAMASFRVHEKDLPQGALAFSSAVYDSRVDDAGLHLQAKGHTFEIRGMCLELGARQVDLVGGGVTHPAFGVAHVDRGSGVTEEFVFENGRVEHLFQITTLPAAGPVRLRAAVQSDLEGPVREHLRNEPTWRDLTLRDGGLAFCDSKGQEVFTYHGAVAIDALGRKQPLDCRWQDQQITIDVPWEFMAGAAFPVTVDPWLELAVSASGGGMSNTATVSQNPSIAVDGAGDPSVAWSEEIAPGNFEIFFRYWNGVKWVTLGGADSGGGISANLGASVNPSLAYDTRSNPMVAWQDDTSGTVSIYVKVWDGTAWLERFGSATGKGVSAQLGVNSKPSLSVTRVFLPGQSTTLEMPLVSWQATSPRTAVYARVYFPGDPAIFDAFGGLIWSGIAEGWYGLGTSAASQGLSNTGFGIASEAPSLAPTFTTAGDPVGSPGVAWQDSRSGNFQTYYRLFVPAAPPLPSTNPNNPNRFGNISPTGYPFVPNGPGGSLTVVVEGSWNEQNGSGTANGVSGIIAGGSAGASLAPSLAFDTSNNPYIAWQEAVGGNTEIFAARNLGGGWSGFGGSVTLAGAGGGVSGGPAGTLSPGFSSNPSIAVGSFLLPTGALTSIAMVAWQDDSSGNSEIFVREFRDAVEGVSAPGGPWGEVLVAGSSAGFNVATQLGGVSQTTYASWQPKVAIAANGNAVVAWQDFVNNAQFDIYVREFFYNSPVSPTPPIFPLSQTRTDGVTVIAVGGSTDELTIQLHATPFSEVPNVTIAIEVEVRPVGSAFSQTPTGRSVYVTPGTDVFFSFTGLPNTGYHWEVRSIDSIGRYSSWFVFGNNSESSPDFSVGASPPSVPTAPVGLSATPSSTGIDLSWGPSSGVVNGYTVLRSTVSGGPYTAIASGIGGTTFSDTTIISNTDYFYVVQAFNALGSSANSNQAGPVRVTSAQLTGPAPDHVDKSRCGLVGLEGFLVLGMLLTRRRRTEGPQQSRV